MSKMSPLYETCYNGSQCQRVFVEHWRTVTKVTRQHM